MGYYCNSTIVIVITIAILCRGGTRALTEARGSYSCRGKGAIFKINRGAVRCQIHGVCGDLWKTPESLQGSLQLENFENSDGDDTKI